MILIPFRKFFRVLCSKEEPAKSLNVLHATPRLCAEVARSYFVGLPGSNLWWILESVQTLDCIGWGRGDTPPDPTGGTVELPVPQVRIETDHSRSTRYNSGRLWTAAATNSPACRLARVQSRRPSDRLSVRLFPRHSIWNSSLFCPSLPSLKRQSLRKSRGDSVWPWDLSVGLM